MMRAYPEDLVKKVENTQNSNQLKPQQVVYVYYPSVDPNLLLFGLILVGIVAIVCITVAMVSKK